MKDKKSSGQEKQLLTKIKLKGKTAEGKVFYIALFGTIDTKSTEELMDVIYSKVPEGTGTVYLLLCTCGGSVSHGIGIYNLLRALPYKIVIHNIANVDSIGNVVFMAGDERYATDNSIFLIHKVKSPLEEQKIDTSFLKEKLSAVDMDIKRVSKIILERCTIGKNELDELYNNGEAKDAEYALERGIIHEIREIPLLSDATIVKVGNSPAT